MQLALAPKTSDEHDRLRQVFRENGMDEALQELNLLVDCIAAKPVYDEKSDPTRSARVALEYELTKLRHSLDIRLQNLRAEQWQRRQMMKDEFAGHQAKTEAPRKADL